MSRKKKIGLIIIIVLCAVLFFPVLVKRQFVQGIAVSSNDKLAVAVRSVINGEKVYLYIYSDDKLQGIRTLTFRGGIGEMTTENDLICIYYENAKYIYDFNGVLLRKETSEINHPIRLHEFKSGTSEKNGSMEYVYSQNKAGFETVKKHTADGKIKNVFGGKLLYLSKILMGVFMSAIVVLMLYILIFYPMVMFDPVRAQEFDIDVGSFFHKLFQKKDK